MWQSLISAYQSLAITTNTPGFEKLNTALGGVCKLTTWVDMRGGGVRENPILSIQDWHIIFFSKRVDKCTDSKLFDLD